MCLVFVRLTVIFNIWSSQFKTLDRTKSLWLVNDKNFATSGKSKSKPECSALRVLHLGILRQVCDVGHSSYLLEKQSSKKDLNDHIFQNA